MTKKRNSKVLVNNYKKQYGLHHKHGGKYLKVYWPYIPVLLIVLTGVCYSVITLTNKSNTSIASSNISVSSLVASTNQARLKNGLGTLQVSSKLDTAAQIKANDLAINNYWSPISPNGTTPWQIINKVGYKYKAAGENLAYGFSSTQSLLSAWLNSPSHRLNVLNNSYSQMGIGIANSPNYMGQGPQTIVVALYGSLTNEFSSSGGTGQIFTSASISQPGSQTITRAESLANKNYNLTIFIIGISSGAIICFLVIRHGLILKKWLVEGEELVIKHPYLDIIVIILLVGMASLNQTVGIIR